MSTSAISSVASTPQTQQPSTTAVGYSRTSSLDLTLTTRDGDTVTISAQQTTAAGVSRTQGVDGDAIASAKATSSSLSVTVDGSLDPHELADIKKVLKTLADGARTQGLHGRHHGHHHQGQQGAREGEAGCRRSRVSRARSRPRWRSSAAYSTARLREAISPPRPRTTRQPRLRHR